MTIGASLLRKLKNAVPWRADTLVDFYEFTESLPAASVLQWTEAVEKWENDNTEVNPFVPTAKSESQFISLQVYCTHFIPFSYYSTWCSARSCSSRC